MDKVEKLIAQMDDAGLAKFVRGQLLLENPPTARLSSQREPYEVIAESIANSQTCAPRLLKACSTLLDDFCRDPLFRQRRKENPEIFQHDNYVRNLVGLVASLNQPEMVKKLSVFALNMEQSHRLKLPLKQSVLRALLKTSPPQEPEFWLRVLDSDPEKNWLAAFTGLLFGKAPLKAAQQLSLCPSQNYIQSEAMQTMDKRWLAFAKEEKTNFLEALKRAAHNCSKESTKERFMSWAAFKERELGG